MYKRFGLKLPKEMKKVVKAYERDNDLMLQFLEDKCETVDNEECFISSVNLYNSYKIWCRGNGYRTPTYKKFIANLNQHSEWFIGQKKSNSTLNILGLKLKV